MTREEKQARRQRENLTFLSYPKVGPLTVGAIRINLGAVAAEVQEALNALLADGRLVRAGATPVPHPRGDAAVPVDEELYTVPSGTGSERP